MSKPRPSLRRRPTLSPENLDEDSSPNVCRKLIVKGALKKIDVPIWQMKEDEVEEEEVTRDPVNRLTGFVRENYLKYLIKLLSQNFESSSARECPDRVFTSDDIERCAVQMEQKALRECIVVRLYQRAISCMAADIKRNTEQLKLHSRLYNFVPPFSDKNVQTEPVNAMCNNSIDTIQPIETHNVHLVTGNKTSVHQLNQNLPHRVEHRNSTTLSDIPLSEIEDLFCPYSPDCGNMPDSPVDDYADLFVSQSHPTQTPISRKELPLSCSKHDLPVLNILKTKRLHEASIAQKSRSKVRTGKITQSDTKIEEPTKERSWRHGHSYQDRNENKTKPLVTKDHESVPNIQCDLDDQSMLTLDERVAMIHGEYFGTIATEKKEINRPTKQKKKLVWRYEKIYHCKILNKRLKSLSKLKRLKIQYRFRDLFGSENQLVGNETKEANKCSDVQLEKYKDRIAPWVVKYLMPYYSKGKIQSREQFKFTAKHVTDELIEFNHLPEESDIQLNVEKLFSTT